MPNPILAIPIEIFPPIAYRSQLHGLAYKFLTYRRRNLCYWDDSCQRAEGERIGVHVVAESEKARAADDVHDAAGGGGEVEVEGCVAVLGVVEGVAFVDKDEEFLWHCGEC